MHMSKLGRLLLVTTHTCMCDVRKRGGYSILAYLMKILLLRKPIFNQIWVCTSQNWGAYCWLPCILVSVMYGRGRGDITYLHTWCRFCYWRSPFSIKYGYAHVKTERILLATTHTCMCDVRKRGGEYSILAYLMKLLLLRKPIFNQIWVCTS